MALYSANLNGANDALHFRGVFARLVSREAWRSALAGDPMAFSAKPTAPEVMGRLRAQQINRMTANTPMIAMATSFIAILFALVMSTTAESTLAYVWALTACLISSFMYLRRKRAEKRTIKFASARGIRLAICYALIKGTLFACLPALFYVSSTPAQQLFIACVNIGMICAGSFALSPVPVAMIAFVSPIILGDAILITLSGQPVYYALGALELAYICVLTYAVSNRAVALAKRAAEELAKERIAHTDELTQLPNRAYFRDQLNAALARHTKKGEVFALMCCDLDGFKAVNDTMGHAAGDKVLHETGQRLKAIARFSDTVARLGGDEFAIIAANIHTEQQAEALAQHIVNAFRKPFEINGELHAITVSIGIAMVPQDGVEEVSLLCNADSALYATKHGGRSGHTFFREQFAYVTERATLESELGRAIKNNEFFLVFQPFVDIQTLRTNGFEALLRWQHPTRGVVGAAQIIPQIERCGLIDAVGDWVLNEALSIASNWPKHLRLAVNVSPFQLRKPNFDHTVRETLARHHFEPWRLELELTESAMILDCESAVATLASLRATGIQTALDDLGTGYSSLHNLVRLPLDRLKIDRCFVGSMEADHMRKSVVKISVELGRAMRLHVTAEGVETHQHLEILRELGCAEGQGYLFSTPATQDVIHTMFYACPVALNTPQQVQPLKKIA